jgi:hypothetical protein
MFWSLAKARKFGVLLVAQLFIGVGRKSGVPVVGPSADKWFLAYLPL